MECFYILHIVNLRNSEYWRRLGLSGTCKNIRHPSSSVHGLSVFLFLPVSEPLGMALILREKNGKIENDMTTYEELQLVAQTFH